MRLAIPTHRIRGRALLLGGVAALVIAQAAAAQSPQGGVAVGGGARITQGGGQTTITQRARRAVIDWQRFDVGRGHRVVFDQPGRAAATLNRVNSARASVIAGRVEAPGTVIIQNTAGVLFTGTARVDVGGLVATSQSVDAGRFLRDGGLRIGGGERVGASVRNHGEITVGEAGLVALVGGNVANAGAIVARKGTVALASGARTTIDLTGDGMIRLAVDGDGAGAVANSGLIDAPDGRVVLSAGGAARALDGVVNTTGVIRATSGHGRGGAVELVGRGEGTVAVAGRIDASGRTGGGSVAVTGERVAIAAGARIDARGGTDGGSVHIGGGLRGEGPLRRAAATTVAAGARIAADGGSAGGTVVVWADGTTFFDGRITAAGGRAGGLVETSGRFALGVGASAAVSPGRGGRWLLDPRDVRIDNGGLAPVPPGTTAPPTGAGPFVVDRNALAATLNAGSDVTITTDQPDAADAGDITVARSLTWNGAGSLRLEGTNVVFAAPVVTRDGDLVALASGDVRLTGAVTSTGSADLVFDAGGGVALDGDLRATGAGDVSVLARAGDVRISERPAGDVRVSTRTGGLAITAQAGSVLIRREAGSGGIQVRSDSGDLWISAGERILVGGGSEPGRSVRVGRAGGSGAVTLRADRIDVEGGASLDAFAEVVADAGGAVSLEARAIAVRSGGSEGRVVALNGADLTMRAETQIWDGPVRAGSDGRDGGDVRLAGAIAASVQPLFGLAPDRSFALEPVTPAGSAGGYLSPTGLEVSTSGTGTIEIGAPVSAEAVTLVALERIGIGAGAGLTATGPGNALVVAAGRRFRNDAGAGVLATTAPGARWLLYVNDFASIVGPVPGPRAFDLYGRTYASTPPEMVGFSGNRIIHEQRPILTITAESLGKTYGSAVAPGSTLAGLRPGDSAATALASGPHVSSAGSPAGAAVGAYATQVAATASGQGYALELVSGALTVDPAPLTVAVDDAARSYGAANPGFTATIAGFVLGQDAGDLGGDLAFATAATGASPVGHYAVTAAGLTSDNYAISYVGGTLSVGRAPLTVTVDDKARTYGAANPALTAHYQGFVLGEDADALGGALATAATQASPAGVYAVSAAGLTSDNYAISYTDGTLTVGKAPLAVRVDDKGRTYGAPNPALTAQYLGFVLGEDAGVLGGALATAATQSSPVGTYAITGAGLTSANYEISFTDGTLTVGKAPLQVAVDDKARRYGAGNPALTARYQGFVLGEDAGVLGGALSTAATRASPVGGYAITAAGLTSGNYTIGFTDGTLQVEPTPLTVTARNAGRPFGAANPVFGARIDGFVLGEGVDDLGGMLVLATAADRASPAGTYAISPSGLTSANYAIDFRDGTLTVTPVSAAPAARIAGPSELVEPYRVGVPPLTPGDASFRTTIAEAPPALASPFVLTYSLGEIVQLAPPADGAGGFVAAAGGLDGADGFVPAAGGLDDRAPVAAACGGAINRGVAPDGCARQTVTESYWATTAESR